MSKIEDALAAAIKATGADLQESAADVAVYTAQQAAKLSLAAGEAGFDEALRAAANNVARFAGLSVVANADAADARAVGIIHGVLIGLAGA